MLRSELAEHQITSLTALDDQRIGDSVYRAIYDTTSASGIYQASLGLYGNADGGYALCHVYQFGSAEVIVVGVLVSP